MSAARCSLLPKELLKASGNRLCILYLAFPYHKNSPPKLAESAVILLVPLPVTRELWFPVRNMAFRDVRVNAARMLVPKASPHVYDPLEPGENDVRSARKLGNMQPKTQAHCMGKPTNHDFRRCIRAPDAPHVLGAALW